MKIRDQIKKKYSIVIPFLHFLLSFIWHGSIFKGFGNWEYFTSVVRNDKAVSAAMEQFIVYVLSLSFCFLIILGFWNIVFIIAKKKIFKSDSIILGVIFLAGLLLGLMMYPDYFGLEIDNYTNFLMARRFQPTYWQSIYTGALYGGCLMFIPHPIALFLVQWTLFWSVVSYIYLNIGKLYSGSKCKYFSLLLFFLPESYYLVFNAYRNNYYTILVMFYVFQLFLLYKRTADRVSIKEVVMFSVFSAFLMVWRSEGVFIGIGGTILFILFGFKLNKKNVKGMAVLVASVCVLYVMLSRIQSIGSEKYYGQDYMIVNTTSVLSGLLNDPEVNLTYEGAENDLQSIEDVIPVEILREYGMNGYRSYNWTCGRYDFNQTLATDVQAAAYMKAYYRIVFNNIDSYLNIQMNCFYNALQLPESRNEYEYDGDTYTELEPFSYYQWIVGKNEVSESLFTKQWENNPVRKVFGAICRNMLSLWREIIVNSGMNLLMHAGALIAIFVMMLKELLYVIEKRISPMKALPFVFSVIVIIGEFAAIMLFMPEGRPVYLYPMLYACYLLIYIFFAEKHNKNVCEAEQFS